jgi:Ca-activated chloride channel family protein
MYLPVRATIVLAGVFLVAACSAATYPQPGRTTAPGQNWPPPWQPPQPAATSASTNAPYGGNTFWDPGVNPYRDPTWDPTSTFAMDVDTASYAVTTSYLEGGQLPDPASVRLEEFVNSFDYGYQPPGNDAFAVDIEGGPSPFVASGLLLRIAITARQLADETRPPLSLTFVIDSSGSMSIGGRLELVKTALAWLVGRLGPADTVAVVTFGTNARIVLGPTSAAEPATIFDALRDLAPDGSTNAQAGLELGYDLAFKGHRAGARDRVVLASDGVANVGLTDATSILGRIDREVAAGVELVTVGVGMGNFNDVLLEQLADRGNGFYAYVNDEAQAEQLFGGRLIDALVTVAKDVRVQVEFRPAAVARYRLLGYENRAMSAQDFSNPAADAGEVGAGQSVTALYEVEPGWTNAHTLGTLTLHWIDPQSGARQSLTRDISLVDVNGDGWTTSTSFRLAATVAGFAELLRQSPYATDYSFADVEREAETLARTLPGHTDVADFARLTSIAARLSPNGPNAW